MAKLFVIDSCEMCPMLYRKYGVEDPGSEKGYWVECTCRKVNRKMSELESQSIPTWCPFPNYKDD